MEIECVVEPLAEAKECGLDVRPVVGEVLVEVIDCERHRSVGDVVGRWLWRTIFEAGKR